MPMATFVSRNVAFLNQREVFAKLNGVWRFMAYNAHTEIYHLRNRFTKVSLMGKGIGDDSVAFEVSSKFYFIA
jgi:hypothetical protein